jgi:hypothetical protein
MLTIVWNVPGFHLIEVLEKGRKFKAPTAIILWPTRPSLHHTTRFFRKTLFKGRYESLSIDKIDRVTGMALLHGISAVLPPVFDFPEWFSDIINFITFSASRGSLTQLSLPSVQVENNDYETFQSNLMHSGAVKQTLICR